MRKRAGISVTVMICALAGWCAAADISGREYEVKALFIVRIAQFIDWPKSPAGSASRPFVFCVQGTDPFGPILDGAVLREQVMGRPAVVKRIPSALTAESCDVVFISSSMQTSLAEVLNQYSGSPVLTVADFDGFVGRGGAVELFLEHGHVRFRIDRGVAEAAGLKPRSQLLGAARQVRGH